MSIGIVETKYGKLRGEEAREKRYEGITYFKGVPYAAPPVGNLRWRPPEDPVCWEGVRECTQYARRCPQPILSAINFEPFQSDFYYQSRPEMSEDCLYLNIATGAASSQERLSLIHIYGAQPISGSNPHLPAREQDARERCAAGGGPAVYRGGRRRSFGTYQFHGRNQPETPRYNKKHGRIL